MDRKDFLLRVGAGLSTLTVLGFIESCAKSGSTPAVDFTIDLTLAKYAALNSPGNSVVVDQVIVVRDMSGIFHAVSVVCTHAGCNVMYEKAQNEFFCPCHGSLFNITGGVLQGPAPTSLANYNITVTGNSVHVFS